VHVRLVKDWLILKNLMASVSAFEAKTRFGQLLERVARGEEVVITKHDKPVARLVPEGRPNLDSVREAVASLRELRKRIAARTRGKSKLSFDDFKSAVEEGRK
jgi:prevent-host-death family protein